MLTQMINSQLLFQSSESQVSGVTNTDLIFHNANKPVLAILCEYLDKKTECALYG